MSTETICPECGYSPVSGNSCSECGARFDFVPLYMRTHMRHSDVALDGEEEQTSAYNAMPDAVSMHPAAAACTFLLGALVFAAEGSGVLGPLRDQPMLIGLGVTNLLLAVGIAARRGAFRALAYMLVPVQIAVVLWVGRASMNHPGVILGALFPLLTLVGTVFDPGAIRRVAALVVAIILMFARTFLTLASPPADEVTLEKNAFRRLGGTVQLAPRFQILYGLERAGVPHPSGAAGRSTLVFATAERDSLGFFTLQDPVAGLRGKNSHVELATLIENELDLKVEPDPLDFGPGDWGKALHVAHKFRTASDGSDRRGILIAAQAPHGRLAVALYMVPAAKHALLKGDALKIFAGLSFGGEAQ